MATKADKTKLFILEKVAPIFNRNGYVGTTLTDITAATGLTKGAIYGNFKDKEELAVKAFDYNVKSILQKITEKMEEASSPLGRLRKIFEFYREYYDQTMLAGGCPVLNIGVDANHRDPVLFARVQEIINRLLSSIVELLQEAVEEGELDAGIDIEKSTKNIFSMIQGSVFLSLTMKDSSYLVDIVDHLEKYIDDLAI
ncbi:MAG TPA: TetR/AcrR family transcriptional regulator [Saprospiraceae bacterium]|nr:TetR/AcrR family transcriptional regulator [Saprospiraceae bacterium]